MSISMTKLLVDILLRITILIYTLLPYTLFSSFIRYDTLNTMESNSFALPIIDLVKLKLWPTKS